MKFIKCFTCVNLIIIIYDRIASVISILQMGRLRFEESESLSMGTEPCSFGIRDWTCVCTHIQRERERLTHIYFTTYNYFILNIYMCILFPQLGVNFQILLYFRNHGFQTWLLITLSVLLKVEILSHIPWRCSSRFF